MLTNYEATATVTAWRKHKCQHCGQKFAYEMTRTGTGIATDWFGGARTASRDAREGAAADVRRELTTDFDCVPCPHCGRFQDEMVARLRRRKTVWWLFGSVPFWLLAAGALLVAVFITVAAATPPKEAPPKGVPQANVDNARALVALVALTAWAVAGVVGFLAALLTAIWWLLRRRFDPYQSLSLTVWRERAEAQGAVTAEQLKRMQAEEKAKEDAAIIKVELDPLTGQIDHTNAPNPFEDAPKKRRKTEKGESGRPLAKPAPPPPQVVAHPVPPPPPPEKNPFDFG